MANAGTTNVPAIYLMTVDRSAKGNPPKFYIGQAVSFSQRRNKHLELLRKGKHRNPAIQATWREYGESAFSFSILEVCECIDLSKREEFWASEYIKKYGAKRMLNIRKLFGAPFWHDPAMAAERSERRRALWRDPDFRKKTVAGQVQAQNRPEAKRRLSETGRTLHGSEVMRERQRQIQLVAQNRPEVRAKKSASIRIALAKRSERLAKEGSASNG